MPTSTPPIDPSVLGGCRALVTGGSDGIGREIATALAAAGVELVLPVRNRTKGEAAAAAISALAPGARIELQDLDLSSLDSVRALGRTLRADARPLHLLIANAGVMTPPRRTETVDGFELQMGTNHLGHAALVAELLPVLTAGSARVVSVTSVAARGARMHWADPNWTRSYDGGRAYGQSKVATGLFGYELHRRSVAGGWGITSAVAHPGVAPTRLLAARPEIDRTGDTLGFRLITAFSRVGLVGTPVSASRAPLLAAVAADPSPERMFAPGGPGQVGGGPAVRRPYRSLRGEADARRAWDLTEELLGQSIGPR